MSAHGGRCTHATRIRETECSLVLKNRNLIRKKFGYETKLERRYLNERRQCEMTDRAGVGPTAVTVFLTIVVTGSRCARLVKVKSLHHMGRHER